MLFFGNDIINIGDNHMKAAEFKGLSWLKWCTGHMCTLKTLPSFAHPDGTEICSGPWTTRVNKEKQSGQWPQDVHM